MVIGQILPDKTPLRAQNTIAKDLYDSQIIIKTIVIPGGLDRTSW